MDDLKKELQVRYQGWLKGYLEGPIPSSRYYALSNLSHVKEFAKDHVRYYYPHYIAELIASHKFIINYPQYFKYGKTKSK